VAEPPAASAPPVAEPPAASASSPVEASAEPPAEPPKGAVDASDSSEDGPLLDKTTLVADEGAPSYAPALELTVDQYASLCAECAVHPERIGEVLARYHIPSDAARRIIDRHWQSRLAEDPELHRQWEQSYANYQTWLMKQRR